MLKDAIIERPNRRNPLAMLLVLLLLGFLWGYNVPASARELSPLPIVPTTQPITIDYILDKYEKPIKHKYRRLPARPPSDEWKARYGQEVIEAARINNIPPNLVMAVIAIESGFNSQARNGGSAGLMQIKTTTARFYGLDAGLGTESLLDPATNIRVATNYLGTAYKRANGNVCLAVSMYNRGLGSRAISRPYCHKVARIMYHPAFQVE